MENGWKKRSENISLLIYKVELKLKLPSGLSTHPVHESKDLNNSAIFIYSEVHR